MTGPATSTRPGRGVTPCAPPASTGVRERFAVSRRPVRVLGCSANTITRYGAPVFVFRCTKKLLHRVEPSAALQGEPPKSTTRLGDWYANLLIIQRQQLVLAVSGVTLLPLLLPAGPFKTMPIRLAEAASQTLTALGVEGGKIAPEVAAMNACFVTTTDSRQVLGMMNDFAKMLPFYLEGATLTEAALQLAECPCSPLAMDSPRRSTVALFGGPSLRLVKG